MKLAGVYTIILLLILAGCTESTTVGGEILDQDQSALVAIDTLTIRTATVTPDELVIHSPNIQFDTYLCGHLDDPVFGSVRADFYTQFQVNENALPVYPDSATIDSLVLILEYNLEGIYGDSTATQEFEIYRIISNSTDTDSTYVSGNELPFESTLLATTGIFMPDYTERVDSSIITSTTPDTTYATIDPFLSIKLDTSLMNALVALNRSGDDQSNETFLSNFGGLAIRPVGGPTGSMLSFNRLGARTGLRLHYHVEDDGEVNNLFYDYGILTTSVRFSSFDNNPNPDIIAAEADGFAGGGMQTYIQGMDGPNTLVQLPYITNFGGEVLVNNAELTVTIKETPDVDLFPPVTQIIVLYENEEGNFIIIEDFLFAVNSVAGIGAFGGQPESFTGPNGELLTRYQMKLSGHLQKMIDGELPNEIYLRVFRKTERANRVVLYGAEHPQYPVTLRANFTNL